MWKGKLCVTRNKVLVVKDTDLLKNYPEVVLEKILKTPGQISKKHSTESNCIEGNEWDNLISFNYIPAQRKRSFHSPDYKKSRGEGRGSFLQSYCNHPSFGSRLAWSLHRAQLCLHPLGEEGSQDNYPANISKTDKIAKTVFSFLPKLSR